MYVTYVLLLTAAVLIEKATADCTPGPFKTHEKVTYHTKWCPNSGGVPVYSDPGGKVVDYMRTTTSWFACQKKSVANPPHGSGKNHYWLLTQGDDHDRWGWFPANAVLIGGQEQKIPGVDPCPTPAPPPKPTKPPCKLPPGFC